MRHKRMLNRGPLYTVPACLLAAGYIWGSMSAASYLLERQEKRLLSEKGRAVLETPVFAWEVSADTEQAAERELSVSQMAEILISRRNNTAELFHDPVAGQISEEEAFEAGLEWLKAMFDVKPLPTGAVRATLSTRVKGGQTESGIAGMEPYYSFWEVVYRNSVISAELTVNAMTGRVWKAEVSIESGGYSLTEYEFGDSLRRFAELAGIPDAETAECRVEEKSTVLWTEDRTLYAEMRQISAAVAMTEDGDLVWESYRESVYTILRYTLNVGETKIRLPE